MDLASILAALSGKDFEKLFRTDVGFGEFESIVRANKGCNNFYDDDAELYILFEQFKDMKKVGGTTYEGFIRIPSLTIRILSDSTEEAWGNIERKMDETDWQALVKDLDDDEIEDVVKSEMTKIYEDEGVLVEVYSLCNEKDLEKLYGNQNDE